MASLANIRARIASVKNTQKITQAMKMVSAAKLRRAQENITNLRPYALGLLSTIADIAVTERIEDPLLSRSPDPKKVLLVVITSDRGLCGGFNASVNKFTEKYLKENKTKYETLDLIFIGKKARTFFKVRNIVAKETIENLVKDISYAMAANLAEKLKNNFSNGDYDEIKFIYSEFKSAIQQDVVCETILPIDLEKASLKEEASSFSKDLIFEPTPTEIVKVLLTKHFTTQVYRCLSESIASEHGARMTAMENSSTNAKDMINKMTITYNNLRQAAITTELIEIVSGAEALK